MAPNPAHLHVTDVVGSTSLVETMGDEQWNHLLHWHDATLRSLFARHGGEEVKRLGDGFFVTFVDAQAAVECAVTIQRHVARGRSEHGFSLPLRIGIHEAEATMVDGGDYRGKGVHEAARITDIADRDEIVVSSDIAAQLPPGGQTDRRSVNLKGLSRRVDVVSIDWKQTPTLHC